MPKFEKNIEKSYEKEFNKASTLFSNFEYKKSEKLFLKFYKYYKGKHQLRKAYAALEKYIIVLIRIGINQNALPRVNEFLDYSIRTQNKQYQALAYGLMGIIYKNSGDFNESITYAKKAKKLFKSLLNYNDLKRTYINIGNSYYLQGNYEDSLKNYRKAEKICIDKNNLEELSGVYQVISFCYLILNDIETFKEYSEKVFEYLDYIKEPDRKADILNNLCLPPFLTDENIEKVLQLLLELLEYCIEHNINNEKVKTLRNLAYISTKQGNYAKAKDYLLKALKISEKFGNEIDKSYIYNNLGTILYEKDTLENVIKNLNKSINLSKKYNIIPLLIDGYQFLGKIYKKEKSYEKSYRYYRETLDYYQKTSDNISSVEQKEQFRMLYQNLPNIIEELNNLIDSKNIKIELEELRSIQDISRDICSKANKQYNNLIREDCIRVGKQQYTLEDELIQDNLETDSRRLFRKRSKYNIKDEGKEIKLSRIEIDLLFEKKCLKDKNSKTTEIDIYGKKLKNNLPECFILGECTYKGKKKLYHKIHCFFNKTGIIANQIRNKYKISHQFEPKFHLVIISMKGFPKKEALKHLENNELNIPRKLIHNIEYIDFEIFKKLLKDNNIKFAKYDKYFIDRD